MNQAGDEWASHEKGGAHGRRAQTPVGEDPVLEVLEPYRKNIAGTQGVKTAVTGSPREPHC